MRKKTYEQPQVEILEMKPANIICASTEKLTQDDFDWGGGSSGSSTEGLTEDNFIWGGGSSGSSTERLTEGNFGW